MSEIHGIVTRPAAGDCPHCGAGYDWWCRSGCPAVDPLHAYLRALPDFASPETGVSQRSKVD